MHTHIHTIILCIIIQTYWAIDEQNSNTLLEYILPAKYSYKTATPIPGKVLIIDKGSTVHTNTHIFLTSFACRQKDCMHVCMYVCMFVCVCVCVCVYVCMYVCMYVCNVCMHLCMHLQYVCMHVNMYVLLCMHITTKYYFQGS